MAGRVMMVCLFACVASAVQAQVLWERDRVQSNLTRSQSALESQSLSRELDARQRDQNLRYRLDRLRIERQLDRNRAVRQPLLPANRLN